MSSAPPDQSSEAATPLPFWRRVAYGAGDFGSNYSWTFVASFAMFYLTNVVGLSAAVVGTLMLVARLLDGVTDVLVGGLIDKTRSRMGKARPWLFWSTFPLAASQIMLFNVPASLPETGKYAYFFIVYLLLGAFFYTASNISYNTLVSLATRNPDSRVQMGSIRFIFAILAVVLLTSTTVQVVDALGGGQTGWMWVSVLYSLIFIAFSMITVFGVKELAAEEIEGTASATDQDISFWKRLPLLASNRYFLLMLGIFLVNYTAGGLTQGGGIYFATYVLGNPALLGLLSFAGMLPIVFTLPFVPLVTKRFGMRGAAVIGSAVSVIGMAIATLYNGSVVVLVIGLALFAIGSAPLVGSMYALLAEVAEYGTLRSGVRMEGTVYSAASVGIKLGTGLGTAVTGWVLALGGFNGLAGVQTDTAIASISAMYLVIPLLLTVARTALLFFLDVETANRLLRKGTEPAPRTESSAIDAIGA